MSTRETEDQRTETPSEPDLRIEIDVMVHHSGFWPMGSPYGAPFFVGNGNDGAHAEAYSFANGPGGVAAPPYPPAYGIHTAPRRGLGISGPDFGLWGWLAFVIAAVIATASLIWLFNHWDVFNESKAQPVGIADVLRSEHFPANYHTLCGITNVAGGTAYKLKLNRGGGCQRTIETTLPVEKIALVHNRSITRSNATFVFNRHPLSGDDVSRIKATALGDQVKVDLRHVVVRLTPKAYQRLRGLPST